MIQNKVIHQLNKIIYVLLFFACCSTSLGAGKAWVFYDSDLRQSESNHWSDIRYYYQVFGYRLSRYTVMQMEATKENVLKALLDPETKTIGQVDLHSPPAHEPGVLPRWLGKLGVDLVIAGGMGQRAQQLFSANGIDVLIGAPDNTPEQLVESYLAGQLACGPNVCDH